MGNHFTACISAADAHHGHSSAASDAHNVEGYTYSYDRPPVSTPQLHLHSPTPTFRWISGASISANAATPLSSNPLLLTYEDHLPHPSNSLVSSDCFSCSQLQPMPQSSGPLSVSGGHSGALFYSGPLDRSSMSGPIQLPFSEPLPSKDPFFLNVGHVPRRLSRKRKVLRAFKKAIRKTIVRGHNSIVAPITGVVIKKVERLQDDEDGVGREEDRRLHWAQGKAGEDRFHVVVWEDLGLLFVGIYDGFYGPDASDFLLSNLYSAVQEELKGLLWEEDEDEAVAAAGRNRRRPKEVISVDQVLEALSRALSKTEHDFFRIVDSMASENPVLGLMGSCVLVMLMKGDDVYLMNLGDSRAVLSHNPASATAAETMGLEAVQLTVDHSTGTEEEVDRVRREHPDDASTVTGDRVKGKLRVTRAFGAGFLKQPKWNSALIDTFRIDYVGDAPYISSTPSLHHRKLGPSDRFLILSSDGLYQYFTNQEAVSEVEHFISRSPHGDPAQFLVEEALLRAADTAGLQFHELLQIQHEHRRAYHDDISVVIISLEGRIWRACF